MAELQTTRYDKIIRRVGGIVATGSMVSENVSELFPMIDVERVPGELLLLGGTEICQASHTNVPGALNAAQVQLFNVDESGKLVTITKVMVSAVTTTITVRAAMANAAIGTATNAEVFRDSRRPVASNPASQIRFLAQPTLSNPQVQVRLRGDDILILEDPNGVAVLSPGFGYTIGSSTINVTLIVTFWWRERPAEPSELNF